MTRSITKPECDRFEVEFAAWLGATIVNKDNLESEVIALFLDIAKIQDKNDFLASTATTLGTVIYIPDEYPLDLRVSVLAHEGEHVLQYAPKPDVSYGKWLDAGQRAALEAGKLTPFISDILRKLRIDESRIRAHGLGFAWLYLTEPEERMVYETHAYCTAMQFERQRWGDAAFMLRGKLPEVEHLVSRLGRGYALSAEHLATARKMFEVRKTEIANGVFRSAVANKAIEILRGISPELVAVAV